MSTAARKARKRLREPYIPPAEKEPTPLLERSISSSKMLREIYARGKEDEFVALYDKLVPEKEEEDAE